MIHCKRRQQGFSLVEMAIVLVILGLLIGGGFSTLGPYLDNAKQSHTMGSLVNTKKALLNYVKVNYYMPCPDTNNDGNEDRVSGLACTSSVGTIPFNSLGLGAGIASDEFGNVFAYGVDTGVTTAASMANKNLSASYFSNTANSNSDFPAFRLETPPTSANPAVATSYTVCKKSAAACDATPSNVEVSSIPAIIVAFNENGGSTALSGCNAETAGEAENCNNDLFVWKKTFSDGAYDDQLVTISGYEIKEQVLDLLNEISLTLNAGAYDGYEMIVRGNANSSNDLNVGTGEDNSFYIDENSNLGEKGDLNANIQLKDGSDTLYIKGNVTASGNADMGAGNDTLTVNTNIAIGGVVTLGTGDDTAVIGGVMEGSLNAGWGNDTVTVKGSVYGTINMDKGDDVLYLYGNFPIANIDGGTESDTLYTTKLSTDFTPEEKTLLASKFEIINYGYVIP